jgi:L-fucose isomerase-like protein
MIRISLLTFEGAPDSVRHQAVTRIEKLIPGHSWEITTENPDILFFLTGGSEQHAAKLATTGRFYLLVGSRHDNAYASATEVKAFLNAKKIPSLLLDEEDTADMELFQHFIVVHSALEQLQGKKLGLIGGVSDWLIASTILENLLKSRLGINLTTIPWEEVGSYSNYNSSGPFLDYFSGGNKDNLQETARVSEMLETAIRKRELDAITVECFPMVQQQGVTACLPLARFNHLGIPAGCEGDICSIAGMMLCKELTGIIPWMANINKVSEEVCMFSHCTISPGLVSGYSVTTHFETGRGTAIEGAFLGDQITIFRFDRALSKAFIAASEITGRPGSATACRTQIEVRLTPEEVRSLRQDPLGNHHLILPGDHRKSLALACLILGMDVI